MFRAVFFLTFAILISSFSWAKPSQLLDEVETHYRNSKTVTMGVDKILKMKLMERTKESEGKILIKNGKIRWETEKPQHTLVLADGKAIWLVDFPDEDDEPVRVIKSVDPKKSQPHAVVAFLLGQGKIGDGFATVSEKKTDTSLIQMDLKPREDQEEFQWLTLFIDPEKKMITKLSFEDSVGNLTTLNFKDIKFGEKIEDKNFKFSPPKNAEVEIVH